jgi:hypothetical protein
MLKIAAVALTALAACDYVAFGGQYTANVLMVLAAIERTLV